MSNPSVSLLPDNPSAHFTPVQGGGLGVEMSGGKRPDPQWKSTPVLIPVAQNSENFRSTPTNVKRFHTLWRKTLGPSVPSRHKPRADPVFVIGSLNEREVKGFVAAPLRGNRNAAQDVLGWAAVQIQMQPETYVVFAEPLTAGGSKADGEWIHRQIESLAAKYPGHIIVVGERELSTPYTLPIVDGIFFYSVPDSEKQIAFGYLPDPRLVYERHTQAIESLDIDTIRTPAAGLKRADDSEDIITVSFRKPSTAYSTDKEMKSQTLKGRHDHVWSAPPGWVSQISFGDRAVSARLAQEGGVPPAAAAPVAPVKPAAAPVAAAPQGSGLAPTPADSELHTVTLGDTAYKVRKVTDAVKADWIAQKFTEDEKRLLEDQQLRYDTKIYALFLEGMVEEQCNTESSTYNTPACGVFRYIMADRMYQKLKQRNRGVANVKVDGASPAPAAAAPAAPPAAPVAPAPVPAPVPAPAPGATADAAADAAAKAAADAAAKAAASKAAGTDNNDDEDEDNDDNNDIEERYEDDNQLNTLITQWWNEGNKQTLIKKCVKYGITPCTGTEKKDQKGKITKALTKAIKKLVAEKTLERAQQEEAIRTAAKQKKGFSPRRTRGGTRKIHLGKGKKTRKNRTQ